MYESDRPRAHSDLTGGRHLGVYEIIERIGAGGMGEVYRARDPRIGRDVAIKILPREFAANSDRLHRFEREARTAGQLNHPNIVAVHDVGTAEGCPFIVTELLDGSTLRAVLGASALSMPTAVGYAQQIAEALAAAHAKGIVHRDLKPENLFVTNDGRVKLLDFGIAKLIQTAGDEGAADSETMMQTEAGVMVGTASYMSPEQITGGPVDHRSDIFAFGAILYEMLSGRRAFQADSTVETLNAILKADPAFSPAFAGRSPELERIIRRCLDKSPSLRFQSARDLAFSLQTVAAKSAPAGSFTSSWVGQLGWPGIVVIGTAAMLTALLWVGRRDQSTSGISPRPIRSIAVLPLENLSGDSGEEYFVDGMTDALIANLGNIEALRVVSRTSIMRYKGSQRALPDIARELKVDGIVEGSVLRVGDRVRINAQLIYAPEDRHLWGKSYERNLRNVLSLQNEIAQTIAAEIEVSVTPRERARLSTERLIEPEAYHLYLKGRYHWNRRTEEDLRRSVEYFQKAIENDPAYALAYAGLADAYNILGNWSVLRADEAFPRAKAAATRALEIDPSLAEAQVALTFARFLFDYDWSGTESDFQRAIELNPNYAPGHQWYAVYLAAAGEAERAVREARKAAELDPLSLIINSVVGWVLYLTRQYDAAIQQCVDVLNMDRSFHPALLYMGEAYEQERSFAKAIDALEAARRLEERPRVLGALGHVYAVAGRTKDAMAVMDELERLSTSRPVAFDRGLLSLGLGDVDRALAFLEQAADEHYPWLVLANVEPRLDPLRGHARFTTLLKRVGVTGNEQAGRLEFRPAFRIQRTMMRLAAHADVGDPRSRRGCPVRQ